MTGVHFPRHIPHPPFPWFSHGNQSGKTVYKFTYCYIPSLLNFLRKWCECTHHLNRRVENFYETGLLVAPTAMDSSKKIPTCLRDNVCFQHYFVHPRKYFSINGKKNKWKDAPLLVTLVWYQNLQNHVFRLELTENVPQKDELFYSENVVTSQSIKH